MTKGVAVTTKRKEQAVYRASALSGREMNAAHEWDAMSGSERLRDAVGAAVMRFAASRSISIEEAQATLIGSEPTRFIRRIYPSATDYTGHRPGEVLAA